MMSNKEFDQTVAEIDAALDRGRVQLRFWTCPVRHPWERHPGSCTVEWDGDIAQCLWRGCFRRSTDPVPRGWCDCEEDACYGECCGAGQCSCTEQPLSAEELDAWWDTFQVPLLAAIPQDARDAMKVRDAQLAAKDPSLRRKIRWFAQDGENEGRDLFVRELRALAALVKAHPDEFTDYVQGLTETVSLTAARNNRRRRS